MPRKFNPVRLIYRKSRKSLSCTNVQCTYILHSGFIGEPRH